MNDVRNTSSASSEHFWDFVRESIIGGDSEIITPFGKRRITYADYTASGRCVSFIEQYMTRIQEHYANTHTEDDATGMITTHRLHQAKKIIKRAVNAGNDYKLIPVGAGTTAAVHRLQQILGLYIPPVAKDTLRKAIHSYFDNEELKALESYLTQNRPVVFVGPYEHHSNEVSWRECYAEVVEVELNSTGLLDLKDLEKKLRDPTFRGRRKIGAFSAASNVSGLTTPVYEVAKILHTHGSLAFFDFAAIAPYGEIDVCRDSESYFDGIYFSPHKFIGGPGSSGILIIHKNVYRADLPPTVGAGGTVDYVSFDSQEYNRDIEVRENPGTPGILQTMKAALAIELKEKLGQEKIVERERELIRRAIGKFNSCEQMEIIGNNDPENRIAIFSFNVKHNSYYLHPRFVARLLSDLFGIQSRAGCSCAGPYGHRVLRIDAQKSLYYKRKLTQGLIGIKPGWVRINFHYLSTEEEFDFLLDAICFICENGKYFLPDYRFNINSGEWRHRVVPGEAASFGIEEAFKPIPHTERPIDSLKDLYNSYMEQAWKLAAELKRSFNDNEMKSSDSDPISYVYFP
jgi:selenocysteine lyase/cysteine desulfurase